MDNNQSTGNRNTGDRNTGNRNTGHLNTGNRNTGDRNTGNRNTGHRNTGNRNTGHLNTGDRNTGHRNTGHRNTGNLNTGHRNTGHRNTGNLNTITPTKGYIFNKEYEGILNINFPTWFYFDVKTTERFDWDDMSEEQRVKYPGAESIGGYLHKYEISGNFHKEWKESFGKASKEDVAKTLELPHFDYSIFEEISGITKEDFDRKLGEEESMTGKKVKVTIDGKEYNAVIE